MKREALLGLALLVGIVGGMALYKTEEKKPTTKPAPAPTQPVKPKKPAPQPEPPCPH